MNIDTALVWDNFLGYMGTFTIGMVFAGLIALCATSAYIFLVYHNKDEEWD